MTNTQLQALKADIVADGTLNALPNNADGNGAISALYGVVAVPDYWVWQTNVSLETILRDPGFAWTRVDNLSVGKARIWEWMFQDDFINPSLLNIRTGIEAVWVGTAPDLAVQAVVLALCKRKATRGEKLFATGAGTTGAPSAMAVEGAIQPSDIETARNLP